MQWPDGEGNSDFPVAERPGAGSGLCKSSFAAVLGAVSLCGLGLEGHQALYFTLLVGKETQGQHSPPATHCLPSSQPTCPLAAQPRV